MAYGNFPLVIVLGFFTAFNAEQNHNLLMLGNVPGKCSNRTSNHANLTESAISEYILHRRRGSYWERPVKDATKPIEVDIFIGVHRLIEIIERDQIIRINGYFSFRWVDEIHTWNTSFPLNCVDYLIIPHGEISGIWVPELAVINAPAKYTITAGSDELVRLYSDGRSQFAPGGMIEYFCSFDLSLFPFDKQICTIHMETWRYTTSKLLFHKPVVLKFDIPPHEQWYIINETTTEFKTLYPNGNEFSTVQFSMHLKRKYGYYMLTVVQPCLLIAAIEIVTFTIPYGEGIRLEVSFTCLLAFTVFHTMVVSDLPRSADNPPLLMILISMLTSLIGFAIFFQSITLYMAGKAKAATTFPPEIAFNIAKRLAPAVMLSPFKYPTPIKNDRQTMVPGSAGAREDNNNKHSNGEVSFNSSKKYIRHRNRKAWRFVATTVDRYSCFLFISLFAVGCVTTLAIIPIIVSN